MSARLGHRVTLLLAVSWLLVATVTPVPAVGATGTPRAMPAEAPTVGLQDPGTGQWHLKDAAGAVTTFYFGNPGDIAFVGDWDCNGTATPGLFRQSDAYAYLRNANSQGNADIRFFFGNPSDVPLAGDFNGDGCDTLSIYRPSSQTFFIMNQLGQNEGGLGAAEYSFVFGNPGDKPVVGDWDGNGIDEIGLHRESTGFFYYRNTLAQGNADGQFFFGDPGDRFVAGDWGVVDSKDTPAVFRPSNTGFYFRHTMTPGNADSTLTWGESGFMPLAGNFGALSGGGDPATPPPGGGHPTSGNGWKLLECNSDVCIWVAAAVIPPPNRTCVFIDIWHPLQCTDHAQHRMSFYGPNGPLGSTIHVTSLYETGTSDLAAMVFSTTIGTPGEYRAEFCRTVGSSAACVEDIFTAHFTVN